MPAVALCKMRGSPRIGAPGISGGVGAVINPGIRRTVGWLNSLGFETTDSGDGKTHDYACDRDYPYVVIRLSSFMSAMKRTFDLMYALEEKGISIHPVGEGVSIQVTWDPSDDITLIDLAELDDSILFKGEKRA